VTRRDLPNIISILRLLIVLPVVYLLLQENYRAALVLFALAGVSDALDGFIAKRFGWTSRLGSILDPVADKALLMSTYVTLGILNLLPVWLVVAIILRDLLIFTGALAYHFLIGKYEMSPSLLSKINTFAQIILALAVVMSADVFEIPRQFLQLLIYTVLATTVLSGVDYVWNWGYQAVRSRSGRHYG
jgi:cardiolipin synthase